MDSNDGSNQPTLTINNSKIYNSSNIGLLARTGYVEANNLVNNKAGQSSLNISLGGRYNFTNCTFANYWTQSYRPYPAVLVENLLETPDQIIVENFFNNISTKIAKLQQIYISFQNFPKKLKNGNRSHG